MLKKFQLTVASYLKEKPLLVIYTLIGTGIFTEIFNTAKVAAVPEVLSSLSYAFVLALALCLGGDYLFHEKPKLKKALPGFVLVLFAIGYFFSSRWGQLPQFHLHILAASYLLFLLAPTAVRQREPVGLHWLVSVLAAVGTSIIISLVLFGLIAFLVWIIHQLFGIELIEYVKHMGLAFFAVFLPINIFALFAPKPEAVPTLRYEMTSLLEKTVRFLFVPVMLIYIAVLLGYSIKILVKLELPVGMVSIPISIAYGMYFVLNGYLESQGKENDGLWKYHKWFEICFIPLFVTMGFGISKRILEYGFTSDRVYLLLGFLVILASYAVRLIYKRLELRKIIALGAIGMLLTSYGPLNPVSISVKSQTARFLAVFQKYKPSFQKLEDFKLYQWKMADIETASSALNSVVWSKGIAKVKAAGLKESIFVTANADGSLEFSLEDLQNSLNNLGGHERRVRRNDGQTTKDERVCRAFELPYAFRKDLIEVTGYDWTFPLSVYGGDKFGVKNLPDKNVHIKIDLPNTKVFVVKDSKEELAIEFGKAVREYVPKTAAGRIENSMVLMGESQGYRVKMEIFEARLDCRQPAVETRMFIKKL